jgi:hypothetical protein
MEIDSEKIIEYIELMMKYYNYLIRLNDEMLISNRIKTITINCYFSYILTLKSIKSYLVHKVDIESNLFKEFKEIYDYFNEMLISEIKSRIKLKNQ